MKLPRFSRNNGSEPPAPDSSGGEQPIPGSKTDTFSGVPDTPGAFEQQPMGSTEPIQSLPFDGVPPPPPPTEAPPASYAPPSGEGAVKKSRFPRFLKQRKNTAAAPSESTNASGGDAPISTPLDSVPQSTHDVLPSVPPPPPPPEGDSVQPPVDPRAAEKEESRRKLRALEIRTGIAMNIQNSDDDGESTDDEARRKNNEEDDGHQGEDEGKPLEDAVVASVSDPPSVPALPTATQSTAFNSTANAFRHSSSQPSAPHFIDTSHIDGAPLPAPPPQHSPFPPFQGSSGNSIPSSTYQPPAPYQTSTPFFPSVSAHQQEVPPQPPHFSQPQNNAAEMAELFASRAFGTPSHSSPFPSQPTPLAPPPPPPPMSATGEFAHSQEDALMRRSNSTRRSAPIGWDSIVDSTPSRPVYGQPVHLSQTFSSPRDLDPALADKIKRGRELAMLAVQEEEKGNLGAAESGYIKALSLLIPASKELDIGSDLTKHVRKVQKNKIQREAAAMLDRCEELRRFIKANGPAVPDELPRLPGSLPKASKPSPPSRESKPKDGSKPKTGKGDRLLPPPPPPTDAGDDDLLSRIANRHKALPDTPGESSQPTATPKETSSDEEHISTKSFKTSDKSTGGFPKFPAPSEDPKLEREERPKYNLSDFNPGQTTQSTADDNDTRHRSLSSSFQNLSVTDDAPSTSNLSPRNVQDRDGSKAGGSVSDVCFLCRRQAHLRTKCNHTFCSNCGNQIVTVFGRCPVPDCNEEISLDDFDHILR